MLTFRSANRKTKHQALCRELTLLAEHLGPDAKLPTLQQLRQSLGISLTTLTGALGELEACDVLIRRHEIGIYVSPHLTW